jgi:hypothetical protein
MVEENKKKSYAIKGILRKVEVKSGEKADGKAWQRASISIENGENKYTVSTFDEKDIAAALKAQNKEVKAVYTLSDGDGKYKNLVKEGITIEGMGEEPLGPEAEESIGEEPKSTKTPESMARVSSFQANDDLKQRLIVRQNSWTQANAYMANCLKAIELGVIEKGEFDKDDFTVEAVAEIAAQIEDKVFIGHLREKKKE